MSSTDAGTDATTDATTASTIDARLAALGIELPAPAKPVASFVPCVQTGNLLFISGQIPSWNGEIRHVGRIGAEIDVATARDAARLCALNALAQARAFLGSLDRIARIVQVQGYVNGIPGFGEQPAVINGASDLFVEVFGDAGRHARFAVGAGSLPFNVAVEVVVMVEVTSG